MRYKVVKCARATAGAEEVYYVYRKHWFVWMYTAGFLTFDGAKDWLQEQGCKEFIYEEP